MMALEEETVGKQVAEKALDEKAFKCDQCDTIFKSENGLKIHVGKTHKKANSTPATPDCLRQQPRSSVSIAVSPLLDTSREESSGRDENHKFPNTCEFCGKKIETEDDPMGPCVITGGHCSVLDY